MKYLDPEILSRLKNLRLGGRSVVEGTMTGLHFSPQRGWSLDFAQLREYSPGDEIRHIDWRVYARSDRFFVRQFHAERSLKAYLLLDASASMSFRGEGPCSKWDYACFLASSLAYLILRQRDSVGLMVFDRELKFFLPPRTRWTHMARIAEALEKTTPGSGTDLPASLVKAEAFFPRRSLLILVSDLWGDPGSILHSIRALRAKKHEIAVLQVLDSAETEFPYHGSVLFEGMEEKAFCLTQTDAIRRTYLDFVSDFLNRYQISFHEMGIEYHRFRTDLPLGEALVTYLTK